MSDKRYAMGEMLALFLLALLLRLAWLGVTVTTDEPTWMERSARFGLALLQGNLAETYQSTHPGVTTMWSGTIGLMIAYFFQEHGKGQNLLDFLASVHAEPYRAALFPMMRLPIVLLTAACVAGVYFLAKRLFGAKVALLSALLLALDPFYLAHSRVLHHDALTASFTVLSLLAVAVYLWGGGGWGYVVFSGVLAALAFLSKLTGLFLGPFVAGTLVLDGLFSLKVPGTFGSARHLRQRLVALALWGLVTGVTAFAIWPALWTGPFFILKRLVYESFHLVESGHTQFFLGHINTDPGPLFYPLAFLFRTTPLNLLGLALLLWSLKKTKKQWRIFTFLLAHVILFPAFITFSAKKGDRYLLPVFPTLDILAAAGWYGLARFIIKKKKLTGHLLPAGMLLFQAGLVQPFYPYIFSYYNPLTGGPKLAVKVLTVGWGYGLDQAGRYLARKENFENLVVAAVPARCLVPFFPGKVLNLDNTTALQADYIVLYLDRVQRGEPRPDLVYYFQTQRPEHVIRINGLEHAWIYPGPHLITHEPPSAEGPGGQIFGGTIRLHGYNLETSPRAGETLRLNLYWQCLAPVGGDYVDYVHLTDEEGHIWSQEDHRPVMELIHTDFWKPGTFFCDERSLSLPAFMPPGRYELRVGWYSVGGGQPLPLLDEAGAPQGTEASLGFLSVARPKAPASPDELDLKNRLEANLAPGVLLLGSDDFSRKLSPGENLSLSLYWQAQEELKEDHQIAFWLQDEAGKKWNEVHLSPAYPTSKWQKEDLWRDWRDLPIAAETPPGEYHLWVGLAGGGEVELGTLTVEGYPRLFTVPPIIHPLKAILEDKAELLGYDLAESYLKPGQTLHLTLYWRALSKMETSYKVFTHLLDGTNKIWGQKDTFPGGGQRPTTGWLPGEIIVDHYEIEVSPEAPPGEYILEVGMYDESTGMRLSVAGGQENRIILKGMEIGE